jgi:TPR repeat protein
MYYNGRGVSKDMSKVKRWIRQAYEGNDVKISKIAGDAWSALELWQY